MQRKLSVVHVIDILNAGGAERVVITLANLFAQHGHKVKVICTVSPGVLFSELDNNVKKISLNRKWKYNPATMYKLISQVKSYDIIHVHSVHNLRYYKTASALFFFNRKIVYHEHHGGDRSNDMPPPLHQLLFKNVRYIAVSKNLMEWALYKLNLGRRDLFLLPNIIIKNESNSALAKPSTPIKLVVVSNILPRKNIAFTVELLKHLNNSFGGKYHLDIIGKIWDENYYSGVMQLIQQYQLQPNIKWITDCKNVQPLLPNYHLALHTALSESGPLVLIEYLSQQLPFITFKTGQVAEQITSFLPGFVEETFIVKRWIEKIERILNEDKPEIQNKMKFVFETQFSSEKYYQDCLLMYQSLK